MLRIAARNGMVLQLPKAARKRDVLGATDILVTQEQHLVLEQQVANLAEQRRVTYCVTQIQAGELGTDAAGQGFHVHDRDLK